MPGTAKGAPDAYEEWRLVFDVPVHAENLDAVVYDARAVAPRDADIHRRLHRIEVRPLSRWRRWLIRQGLLGSYGAGGGGGEGGGGGNGGGG
jgi:hypothetical protein